MRMNEGYMNGTMSDREVGMECVKPGSLAEDTTNKRPMRSIQPSR